MIPLAAILIWIGGIGIGMGIRQLMMEMEENEPAESLIGKKCWIYFNLPSDEWPVAGSPAFATVEAVEMPLIKLATEFGNDVVWVNANIIKTIRPEIL